MPRKSCNSCGNFVDCGKKDHACLNSGRSVWVAKEMTPAEYYERWCKLQKKHLLPDLSLDLGLESQSTNWH